MKHETVAPRKRKAVNLSINPDVIADARAVGINISQVSEKAIKDAIRAERGRRWQEENREAMDGWNRWVEKNGLPLEKYRLF